jgi:hypothetical protein
MRSEEQNFLVYICLFKKVMRSEEQNFLVYFVFLKKLCVAKSKTS